jgi:hypothetical protein
MPRGRELKLRVEDRPGMLGEIALALSERKVNIRAVNSWVEGSEAVLRLVVDQVGVAKKALAARGWKAEEQEILEVELADKPGALAALAGALGQAGVNITHAYGGTAGARKASVFLAVSDLKAALKAAR